MRKLLVFAFGNIIFISAILLLDRRLKLSAQNGLQVNLTPLGVLLPNCISDLHKYHLGIISKTTMGSFVANSILSGSVIFNHPFKSMIIFNKVAVGN